MVALDSETSTLVNDRISAVLADGKWHGMHEFLPIGDLIPAELASRFYRIKRLKKQKDLSEIVMLGRRAVIARRLRGRARGKSVQSEGKGFESRFRLMQNDDTEANIEMAAAKLLRAFTDIGKMVDEAKRPYFLAAVISAVVGELSRRAINA